MPRQLSPPNRAARILPPLLTAALAAACVQDAAAPAGDLVTTFDTINGVIHVTNTGTPPPASLMPVVSIGPKSLTDTGSPDEFGGVTSVALGPDGDVFVADGRNLEVRVFGLDGAHRRTFGRAGEGPGEFRHIYVGLDSRGATGDTLAWLTAPPGGLPSGIMCHYEDAISFFTIPFAPQFVQHPGPGGLIYSALTSSYRIAVTRNEGADTLRVIERPLPSEPIGDDEWEAGNEEFEEFRKQRRSASCEPSGPIRPDTRPLIELSSSPRTAGSGSR